MKCLVTKVERVFKASYTKYHVKARHKIGNGIASRYYHVEMEFPTPPTFRVGDDIEVDVCVSS